MEEAKITAVEFLEEKIEKQKCKNCHRMTKKPFIYCFTCSAKIQEKKTGICGMCGKSVYPQYVICYDCRGKSK